MSNELGYTSIYGDDGDDNEWTFFFKEKKQKTCYPCANHAQRTFIGNLFFPFLSTHT